MTLEELIKHIQNIQSELRDKVKEDKGYGNSYDNGVDNGWLQALVYVETRLKGRKDNG